MGLLLPAAALGLEIDFLVRNRFKGLDLIDRVLDELWNEVHDIVQGTVIKTIPMEKKCAKNRSLN